MSLLIFGKGKTSLDAAIEPMKGLYYSPWPSSSTEFCVPLFGRSYMTKHVLAIIYMNNWILVLLVSILPLVCERVTSYALLLAVCFTLYIFIHFSLFLCLI
jgi:hypothetical protein